MHIYHYAAYERTHLLSLAARHGVGEEAVDDLLRESVLVDLYPFVRKALVVGSRSYSIKKLEPLYMGEDRATATSPTPPTHHRLREAIEELRTGDVAEGQRMLAQIAEYNEYDCGSTRRLRDWLLSVRTNEAYFLATSTCRRAPSSTNRTRSTSRWPAVEHVDPLDRTPDDPTGPRGRRHRLPPARSQDVLAGALQPTSQRGRRMGRHPERLRRQLGSVERDWAGSASGSSRATCRCRGLSRPAVGSGLEGRPTCLRHPGPSTLAAPTPGRGARRIAPRSSTSRATVDTIRGQAARRVQVGGTRTTSSRSPSRRRPPRARRLRSTRSPSGAAGSSTRCPRLPADPALDLLRRGPPRGALAPIVGDDTVGAVVATLLGLDDS